MPKAAGADAPNDGGALPRIVRSRTLGPRFRREGQLRVPRLVYLSRRSPTRRSRHLSVGTAFQMSLVGIILNRETTLRPCRPMRRWGWLPIPKHPSPLVRMHSPNLRMQAEPKGLRPAKALRVERMMGTAMGRREIPLPLPMSYRAATILWMGAGPVGAVDPIHLTMTMIRLIPGTMNLARTRSIMHPLKVRMLVSLCITESGLSASVGGMEERGLA